MQPAPVFRRARPEEAAVLSEIAFAAKRFWGYPDEWMAGWRDELTLTPDHIRASPVWVVELGGETAGFFGLKQADNLWHLEHLWVRPSRIGNGLGRALFDEAVRQARAAGVTELRIKCDPNAELFYLKMGAVRTGLEVYQHLGKIRRELPLLSYQL